MLAAIEARRAASLRKLTEAEARADSLRQQAQLANIGRILGIEEETGRERREGMAELAAKGVARSPLFANPFRRELAREQQEKVAESEQTLANTLDKLQATLEAARQQRQTELSQIEFDVGQNRSNVAALLGIA
jgi:predicted unusual protein kinase regulating ubiquinone biosynthesis (AarF/ABC1/UbiB family)